jgi:hypothetical protein
MNKLSAILQLGHALFRRAMITTKHLLAALKSVADNAHTAVCTTRREHVNRALEAVKCVSSIIGNDLEGLIVFVAARVAFLHLSTLFNNDSRQRPV